jgi:hypothetical protein
MPGDARSAQPSRPPKVTNSGEDQPEGRGLSCPTVVTQTSIPTCPECRLPASSPWQVTRVHRAGPSLGGGEQPAPHITDDPQIQADRRHADPGHPMGIE